LFAEMIISAAHTWYNRAYCIYMYMLSGDMRTDARLTDL